MARALLVAAMAALALAGCGEPEVDVELPARADAAPVADLAGVLGPEVAERLERLRARSGYDVVALTFESDRASLGEAQRGGERLLEEWGADVALTAVGFPGDFAETDADDRRRYFGVEADRFAVTRGLRDQIVEVAVPPPAADNDWTGAFLAAIDVLEDELGTAEG